MVKGAVRHERKEPVDGQSGVDLLFQFRHPQVERQQLVAFQNDRLRRLIDHAFRNVTYYRALFDRHGLKPHDIRTVEDLAAAPITTKNDLQNLPVEEILARNIDAGRLITHISSGSSGQPFMVRRTWLEERLHGVLRFRALRSLGLRAGDKHGYVMRLRSHQRQDHQIVQGLLATFGIARQRVINALQSPEDIVEALHRFRPAVVSGYPGVLARLAQTVDSDDLGLLKLRFVSTGGEVLTPLMRQQIQDGFSVPVYDTYGSIECNLLAWECRATGEYHSCDDGVIMEILRDGIPAPEGERGELVCTDLHSFAMPLIRYRLGDVATKGGQTCRCGQPFSTLRSIQGRMIDYFVLPGNRVVHPYELGIIKHPWIRAFQVVQESLNCIVMRVVPFHKPTGREMAALVQPVVELVGRYVQVHVVLVPEIPMETNGKFRVYRSCIRSAYDGLSWSDQTEKPALDNGHA